MKGIPPSLTLLFSTGQSADSLAWHKMSFTIWLCPGFSDLLCPFANLSLVAQMVKNLLAVQETWVRSLGWEDPLEKGTATHSSILAWRIPWTDRGIAESDMTEPTNTLLLLCISAKPSYSLSSVSIMHFQAYLFRTSCVANSHLYWNVSFLSLSHHLSALHSSLLYRKHTALQWLLSYLYPPWIETSLMVWESIICIPYPQDWAQRRDSIDTDWINN